MRQVLAVVVVDVVVAAVVAIAAVAAVVVDVVIGSDVDVNVIRPTYSLYWVLQHILHSKCRKHQHGRCFLHHVETCLNK